MFEKFVCDHDYQIWAKRLVQAITANHDERIAPKPLSGILKVDVTFRNAKLVSLNSIDQTLTMLSDLNMSWNDSTLIWDPADYSGIDTVVLPRKLIWQPDIFAFNMKDYKDLVPTERATIRVESTGLVNLDLTMVFTQICNLVIGQFPFDNQTCDIGLASATMNSKELSIMPHFDTEGYEQEFAGNGEWIVTKMDVIKTTEYGRNMSYDLASLTIEMKREPIHFVVVIIIPTFLLVAVCILGIFGPNPESDIGPEKVPLAMATLMSMTVLLSIIAGALPLSEISVLGYFIIFEILICAAAAFVSVTISFTRTIKLQFLIVLKMFRKRKAERIRRNAITAQKSRHLENGVEKFLMKRTGSDDSMPENTKMEKLESFLASWFEFREEMDEFLNDHRKRAAKRTLKERNAASWSHTASVFNMILCFVFEALNIVLLLVVLNAWQ